MNKEEIEFDAAKEAEECVDALVADVTYEKTYPEHTAYYQLDLNKFEERVRKAILKSLTSYKQELEKEIIQFIWNNTEIMFGVNEDKVVIEVNKLNDFITDLLKKEGER
jgi:hypothetical protein